MHKLNQKKIQNAEARVEAVMKHRVKIPLLIAVAFFFITLTPLPSTAAQFSELFVFGDSLSDTGNVFNASKTATGTGTPPPPYFQGRFSNGLVWVDYLAKRLNLNPVPVTTLKSNIPPSEGINFAFGGATISGNSSSNASVPGLQQQVAEFQDLVTNQSADRTALFIFWIGANDYLPTLDQATSSPDPEVAIQQIMTAVRSLYERGARHFLVANLPDLSETPLALQRGASASARLKTLSDRHNALLKTKLDALQRSLPEIHVAQLDVNEIFQEALADKFSFTHFNAPCYERSTGSICTQPDQYLFWDAIHPTTAAHRQISEAALKVLEDNTAAQTVVPAKAGLFLVGTFSVLVGAGLWRQQTLLRKRRRSRL